MTVINEDGLSELGSYRWVLIVKTLIQNTGRFMRENICQLMMMMMTMIYIYSCYTIIGMHGMNNSVEKSKMDGQLEQSTLLW